VHGSLAAAARALGSSIGRYHQAHMNRTFIANDSAVSLPASVAPDILGVAGLNNHYPPRHSRAQLRAQTGGAPAGGYTAAQLKTAYDANAAATAGYAGSG